MILYGASGHGKVVKAASRSKVILCFDDNPSLLTWEGLRVIRYDASYLPEESVVISIGSNKIRSKIACSVGHIFATVIAESAEDDNSCEIGDGSQVFQKLLQSSCPYQQIRRANTIIYIGFWI